MPCGPASAGRGRHAASPLASLGARDTSLRLLPPTSAGSVCSVCTCVCLSFLSQPLKATWPPALLLPCCGCCEYTWRAMSRGACLDSGRLRLQAVYCCVPRQVRYAMRRPQACVRKKKSSGDQHRLRLLRLIWKPKGQRGVCAGNHHVARVELCTGDGVVVG